MNQTGRSVTQMESGTTTSKTLGTATRISYLFFESLDEDLPLRSARQRTFRGHPGRLLAHLPGAS